MKKLTLVASLAILCSMVQPAFAQKTYKFKKGQLVSVSGKQCGLISNIWRPVAKAGAGRYKLGKGQHCKSLLAPTSLKKSGLAGIPSASGLLKSRNQSAALSVIGTPPAVKEIPNLGVKNVFWSPGFIDGVISADPPSQSQCNEFFHGTADGDSAGMLGCYAVQGVAYAFQTILEGGTSACFMKNMPTKANMDSGGVQIIDGSLPGGDITKLFSTPAGSKPRVVKIQINGFEGQNQVGFIKINSQSNLEKMGHQYSYKIWFCNEGQNTPSNYEETSVSLAGIFKYLNVSAHDTGEFQNEITASLTKKGSSIEFDSSKERVARSIGEFEGANFKSQITVLPNNTIQTKVKESFNGFGRSNYGVAEFSGSSLSDFAVHSAALKDVFASQSKQAGIEYRESLYASAPSATLLSELNAVDIDTDSFYDQSGSVTLDPSGMSCSQDADVTIEMNFAVSSMQAIAQTCQGQRLENMDFCRVSELTTALTKCQP